MKLKFLETVLTNGLLARRYSRRERHSGSHPVVILKVKITVQIKLRDPAYQVKPSGCIPGLFGIKVFTVVLHCELESIVSTKANINR